MGMRSTISNKNKHCDARIDFARVNPLLLRRIFSSRVLKDLASNKLPAELAEVIELLVSESQISTNTSLSELYESAFRYCFRHQRVEYFYKNAVIEKLVLGRRSLNTVAGYVEVRIADAKLDVLLSSKQLTAYEIKTDFDELARLPTQLRAYQRACREVSVVTGDRYASVVERIIPPEVGLLVLTDRYQLRVLRPATVCDGGLSPQDMLALLRRKELLSLLREMGVDADVIPNTRTYQEAVAASKTMCPVAINSYVATTLLERSASKRSLVRGMPTSLAACSLAQDLTGTQIERLIKLFEMDVIGGLNNELSPVLSG